MSQRQFLTGANKPTPVLNWRKSAMRLCFGRLFLAARNL
jgi:hypothetical protein